MNPRLFWYLPLFVHTWYAKKYDRRVVRVMGGGVYRWVSTTEYQHLKEHGAFLEYRESRRQI